MYSLTENEPAYPAYPAPEGCGMGAGSTSDVSENWVCNSLIISIRGGIGKIGGLFWPYASITRARAREAIAVRAVTDGKGSGLLPRHLLYLFQDFAVVALCAEVQLEAGGQTDEAADDAEVAVRQSLVDQFRQAETLVAEVG